jgi:amidase|tara:strand:- start:7770 stop:9221 length:1452 start_codon:yes stop_codon:yes gene_type:complete
MGDIALLPARDLAAKIRAREVGSRELLEHYLKRVESFDPELNAIVWADLDAARERAEEADKALARGENWGPLHGLPMTIKELFETKGMRWTAGDPKFAERVGQVYSPAVARIVNAGAVIFGVTNSPLNGSDTQTYNAVYGTTNNPWDKSRSPGGSSGGTAVVLATGMSALDLGSDIGGSIRNPAHYTGIYGHKPSFGIVPRCRLELPGMMAAGDLSVAGPLARCAEDLQFELDIIAGPEANDAVGWRLDLPKARRSHLAGFRVAAWLDDPDCPVDSQVLARLEQTVSALEAVGVTVDTEARPDFDLRSSNRIYRSLLNATSARGMLGDVIAKVNGQEDAIPLEDAGEKPTVARTSALRHREWLHLSEARAQIRAKWNLFFRDYDVLLTPVTPVAAIEHLHIPTRERTILVNGEAHDYWNQLTWAGLVTLPYLPATVAPVGQTSNGLPVGLQIVGPYLEDSTTIEFARLLGDVHGGYVPPPGYE